MVRISRAEIHSTGQQRYREEKCMARISRAEIHSTGQQSYRRRNVW